MATGLPFLIALFLVPGPGQAPSNPQARPATPSQAAHAGAAKRLDQVQKELKSLVDLLKNRIDVEKIREALKNRKPVYQVVKPPAPKAQASPRKAKAAGETSRSSTDQALPPEVEKVPPPPQETGAPGDVVLKVDGLPVTRGEIQKISGFIMSYSPDLPPEECQRKALESIIARAHVESRYKDRLAAMRKKIEAIRKRIVEKGEIFADVAREVSDCPSKKNGGDLGEVSHGQMVQPFEYYAFTTPKGRVSPVFLSPYGFHILKVIQEPRGMDPASLKVRVRHILVAFDKNVARLQQLIREARAGKAEVKVLDPALAPALPAPYRH